ncbi:Dcp1p-Dcp2p decapping enzyme complex alpha subunit [Coemansia erecta]|uniref:mRNA guanylyltransferase n=1 Tax=Coemansia erecta TaxID=147472 RepID=A0A9W7XUP1_9FUNG|nr:Dcp1p-Dcp2p decapping enzyme complex alpha subunit [Coemansia erecta]
MGLNIPKIPGVQLSEKAHGHLLLELRRTVQQLCGSLSTEFPGSQPVSFTRHESIPALMENDYYVCEKSDGIRVLVLIGKIARSAAASELTPDSVYFVTRRNEYYEISTAPSQPDTWTIIDAELVVDVEDDGRRVQRLLAFDVLAVDGICCMMQTLPKRLGRLEQQVVKVLNAKRDKQRQESLQSDMPFELLMKRFELSYGAARVMREVVPKLKHASDGLIFTAVDSPYISGTCIEVIKWKPADENSVDMLANVVYDDDTHQPIVQLYVWEGFDRYSFYGFLSYTQTEWEEVIWPARGDRVSINGCIMEVLYQPGYRPPAKWRFMRVRSDKQHANHVSVITRILQSIDDGLDFNELEAAMADVRLNWKQRAEKKNNAFVQKQSVATMPAETSVA